MKPKQIEYNKTWRHKAKAELKAKLGGKCVDCGTTNKLEFSHVIPLTDEQCKYRVKIGANGRVSLYRRDAAEGLLTLRCSSCNSKQAARPKQGFLSYNVPTVVKEKET